jgi:regulator of CtrA degradation
MDAGQDGNAAMSAPVVDRMFSEAITLLESARTVSQSGIARAPGVAGTKGQVEALRITARLANSVAWLLAAKAVNAGEISAAEMARYYALDSHAHSICMDERATDDAELHPSLRKLMASSLALYRRLARLDQLMARRTPH